MMRSYDLSYLWFLCEDVITITISRTLIVT